MEFPMRNGKTPDADVMAQYVGRFAREAFHLYTSITNEERSIIVTRNEFPESVINRMNEYNPTHIDGSATFVQIILRELLKSEYVVQI